VFPRKSKIINHREIKLKFANEESKIVKDETYSIVIHPEVIDISKKDENFNDSKEVIKDNNYFLKIEPSVPVSNFSISSRKGSFFKVIFYN
jgi:hypothetical protein